MKIALVTGASSGIGKATAEILAASGYNVIVTGRRAKTLFDLEKYLREKYRQNILAVSFDITDQNEVQRAINKLPNEWKSIDVLVNNAGLALGVEPFQEGNTEDWEVMIDTNLKGLLFITRFCAPVMIQKGAGDIVNIGSIAGKEVYPGGNVYCATKFAVDALSRAMRIDMLSKGIRVTNICPGMVETEFSIVRNRGDQEKAKKVYEGLIPLTPEDVAEAILFAITRPRHVCINDMLIMPTAQASSAYVNRDNNQEIK